MRFQQKFQQLAKQNGYFSPAINILSASERLSTADTNTLSKHLEQFPDIRYSVTANEEKVNTVPAAGNGEVHDGQQQIGAN